MAQPFDDIHVKETFDEYPPEYRAHLLKLREMIFKTAKEAPEVGTIKESLKWGEPSYEPLKPKIGSAVRIHWLKTKPDQFGMYFNCNTNLLERIEKKYPGQFIVEGKRAIIFTLGDTLPMKDLRECILMALTYHISQVE